MKLNKLFLLCLASIVLLLQSCEKESVTTELDFLEEKLENVWSDDYVKEGPPIDEAEHAQILAQAEKEFRQLNKFNRRVKSTGFAHWVGVLAGSSSCPSGVAEIRYRMDLEDNNSVTKYKDPNCYKAGGLTVTDDENLYWVVCIVDANRYNFTHMSKAYAIFDLSHIQYLRGAGEVRITSDDENRRNANSFDCPSYGFTFNTATTSNSMPIQRLEQDTKFSFYYFTENLSSTNKLPKLGFDYAVFSNFDCCSLTNQNIVYADTDDRSALNSMIYFPENSSGINMYNKHLDAKYQIFYVGENINYYIQQASVYMD